MSGTRQTSSILVPVKDHEVDVWRLVWGLRYLICIGDWLAGGGSSLKDARLLRVSQRGTCLSVAFTMVIEVRRLRFNGVGSMRDREMYIVCTQVASKVSLPATPCLQRGILKSSQSANRRIFHHRFVCY